MFEYFPEKFDKIEIMEYIFNLAGTSTFDEKDIFSYEKASPVSKLGGSPLNY